MQIRTHLITATLEIFLACVLGLMVGLLPFENSLFQGPNKFTEFVGYCVAIGTLAIVIQIIIAKDTIRYRWHLDGKSLLMKQRGTGSDVTRINFEDIYYCRCRRVVPFVGWSWIMRLTMKEILPEPPVLFSVGSVRVTGRAGMRRLFHIRFITRGDKDKVLAAIANAEGRTTPGMKRGIQ